MGGPSFAHKASSLRTFASEKAGEGQSWLCRFFFFASAEVFFLIFTLELHLIVWELPKHWSFQMKFCEECLPIPIKDNYFPRDVEDENVFC